MNNQLTMSTLEKGQTFEGFLMVRSADTRQDKNGKSYLDMMLYDRTGEMNAKVWDPSPSMALPQAGGAVKVQGTVTEFNGRKQLRIARIRPAEEKDQVDYAQLLPCAPERPEVMRAEIDAAASGIGDPVLRAITLEMLRMAGDKLAWFPAAQRVHHAERSGLLHHTLSMLRSARALLPLYPYLDGDLVQAGVIIHDLSKTDEMLSDVNGNVSDYSPDGLLLGHLVRGVTRVREAAARLKIDPQDERVLLLEHMVISHHGEAEFGSPRPPMFPEAEMLHQLDNLDAKMNEMETIQNRLTPGTFSERVFSLDRRMYRPKYKESAEALPFDRRDEDSAYRGLLG